jgi:hypothetical protein
MQLLYFFLNHGRLELYNCLLGEIISYASQNEVNKDYLQQHSFKPFFGSSGPKGGKSNHSVQGMFKIYSQFTCSKILQLTQQIIKPG